MRKKVSKKNTIFDYGFNGAINLLSRLSVILLVALIMFGCSDDSSESDENDGNWIELSDFEGVARSGAVAFTIGDKAYVGTGYDGTYWLKDFWEYDPLLNNWTRKADFPGGCT